ncbi:MAG: hypothetical protein A3E80_03090 [Chlamydiae bacterium RIFCSPHIGHO2_12_FULL_49_9]|nr:MAG: hypothetical protein A3E80_03090 [Chlamydiae bacterium RIFCSPHIGHO2_12_FULL_49_9]
MTCFKNGSFFFLLCLLVLSPLYARSGAVTYDYENGRFGDSLLNYLHAKWFSFDKGIPLLYKPFPYSDQLTLSEKEIAYKDKPRRRSLGIGRLIKVHAKYWPFLSRIRFLKFCYRSNYFPEDPWELNRQKFSNYRVNWKNEQFRKIVKEMISPKKPLHLIYPPAGVIGVALHVREGGDFDPLSSRLHFPLKFPPLDFYADGLKAVMAQFPDRELYCYLFTDAKNPAQIAAQLRDRLPPAALVQFHFREKNNHGEANVLEDFFSLFNFEVLIRSQSNFSIIPSLIHDFAFVYAPKDCLVEGNSIVITEVEMVLNTILCQKKVQ